MGSAGFVALHCSMTAHASAVQHCTKQALNPTWRSSAVFSRAALEELNSRGVGALSCCCCCDCASAATRRTSLIAAAAAEARRTEPVVLGGRVRSSWRCTTTCMSVTPKSNEMAPASTTSQACGAGRGRLLWMAILACASETALPR